MDWHDPTEQEKKAIHNVLDCPIVAIIDGLTPGDRKKIYDSIWIKDEHKVEYNHLQIPWISDFKEYWGEKHCQDPDTSSRFSEEYLESGECERYKLYYAVKNPDKIEIRKVNRRVLEFFLEADEVIKIENLIVPIIK